MATKLKPQGPRYKKFEIWTKVAKLAKPQGPKWQFTLYTLYVKIKVLGIKYIVVKDKGFECSF
ncbi:hypothetical protein Hanom_Chr00s162137g01825571 [Helianthus anomalus]